MKLTSITATRQNTNIAVSWKVEDQVNVIRYEVEKSADGSSFSKVSTVAATGGNNASATYSWLDENAFAGMNYYRIRMVDGDGRFSYSQIVRLHFTVKDGITIYPNPVTNNTYHLKMTG